MKRLLLHVTASGYTADAVFVKADEPDATWRVESTAPVLAWMRSYDMAGIKRRLSELGVAHEWRPCDANYDPGIALWKRGVAGALKADAKKQAMALRRNTTGERKSAE